MSKQRNKPKIVAREEWLQQCAARAQQTDRQARQLEEEMIRLRKEAKRARKAYRAAKEAAKEAVKEAREAQAELRACLDDALREMAHTLNSAATAEGCPPTEPAPEPSQTGAPPSSAACASDPALPHPPEPVALPASIHAPGGHAHQK